MPRFIVRPSAGGKFQVFEPETELIWRTLNSRAEANEWLNTAEPRK